MSPPPSDTGPPGGQPAQERGHGAVPAGVRQHHLLDQQPPRHGTLLLGAHRRTHPRERRDELYK